MKTRIPTFRRWWCAFFGHPDPVILEHYEPAYRYPHCTMAKTYCPRCGMITVQKVVLTKPHNEQFL